MVVWGRGQKSTTNGPVDQETKCWDMARAGVPRLWKLWNGQKTCAFGARPKSHQPLIWLKSKPRGNGPSIGGGVTVLSNDVRTPPRGGLLFTSKGYPRPGRERHAPTPLVGPCCKVLAPTGSPCNRRPTIAMAGIMLTRRADAIPTRIPCS